MLFARVGDQTAIYPITSADANLLREINMSIPGGASRQFPLTLVLTGTRANTAAAMLVTIEDVDCSVAFGPSRPVESPPAQ